MAKKPLTLREISEGMARDEEKLQEEERATEERESVSKTLQKPTRSLRDIATSMGAPEQPKPENVSDGMSTARMLHLKEAVRKFGKEYDYKRREADQEESTQLAAKAFAASNLDRPKTAEDYAKIDAFKMKTMSALGGPKTGAADSAIEAVGALANTLDLAQRPIRAAGWRLHTPTWKQAWDISKDGWSDDLMQAGLPWWGAYLIGIPLEAATDPAMVGGFGLGFKNLPVDEISEMALKSGSRIKGTPAKLGVYLRGKSGKRAVHGIPGTKKVGTALADLLGAGGKKFIQAKEPTEGILRTIYKGLSQERASEASFAMKKAWRNYGDQVKALKLEPEALQRSWMAAEYVSHSRRGQMWADDAIEEITMGSSKERNAAELLRDGFDAVGEVVNTLDLKYPAMTKELVSKRKLVERKLAQIEKRARKVTRTTRGAVRKATAAEETLTRLGKRQTQLEQGIGDTISKRAGVVENLEMQKMKQLLTGQVEKVESSKLDELVGVVQEGKAAKAVTQLGAASENVASIVGQGSKKFQQRLQSEVEGFHQLLKDVPDAGDLQAIAKHTEDVKAAKKSISGLSDEIKQATTQRTREKVSAETAYEQTRAYYKAGQASKKLREIHKMGPAEWEQAARKTLTMKEYKEAMTPTQFSKVTKMHTQLEEVYKNQARLTKRSKLLQETAEKKITKANAFKRMEEYQNLMDKARQIDEAAKEAPDYLPRVTAKSQTGPVAQIRKTFKMQPSPLSESGAAKSRTWLTDAGRPKYLREIEDEFRQTAGLLSKQKSGVNLTKEELGWLSKNNHLQTNLKQMFGVSKIDDAVKKANDVVRKGGNVVGEMFEIDPTLSIPMSFKRITKDVETKSMIDGLRLVASDIQDAAHSIKASQLGTRVAAQYKGKFFPQGVADELTEWTNRLKWSEAEKVVSSTLPARMFDVSQGLWKFQATGFWPAFHFRNAISDMMRAATNGPFNPVAVYRDGYKAVLKGAKSTVDLGKLGKVSGADLWDLAESYRVTGGYYEEIIGKTKGWKKPLRLMSMGEDVRRVGYFADRIRQGFSPAQASRDTLKVFFDYKALAPWEKGIAKRAMPWWAFRRNNMAFQVEKLLSQPYWTAAQMRLLRSRDKVDPEMPEWYPDRLKGRSGVVVNEKGVTSLVYGIDLGGVEDLTNLLDNFGHPKGALKQATEQFMEEISPVAKAMVQMPMEWVSGKSDELVDAPRGSENLPQSVKDHLGMKSIKKRVGKTRIDQWVMPQGGYRQLRLVRAFSEGMKFFRYDNTKTMDENKLASWTSFLTGLSKREISEGQVQEMILRERMESLQEKARKNKWLYKHGNLIPSAQRSAFGREWKLANKLYRRAYQRRVMEEAKKRMSPSVQD